MKENKILGLIPTRLGSTRLPSKPLLEINGLPLIIHTYRRALLSNSLDDLYICCDDKIIANVAKKFKAKFIMTSKHHKNGTERIAEAFLKLKKKFDFIIDIQGDEPLISPYHISEVIKFHKKNMNYDIILPTLEIKVADNTNLIKVVTNKIDEVMYLSRAKIPLEFKEKSKSFKKHLSIISFLPESLIKFSKNNKTPLEKIEDIELLRALELNMKIKSLKLKGDSFSIDVHEDYLKAIKQFKKDKFVKKYI
jgi:3-deoxy-manno-octulosonate cytidylyltransferase (CMP-KDO synthetase)